MNGISTRYSSSLEWKKAQTWQERLRTDPARRTGSMASVMILSFVSGVGNPSIVQAAPLALPIGSGPPAARPVRA